MVATTPARDSLGTNSGYKVTADLFAFLTTEPNALVKQYHPKAMPVILTTQDEIDTWMEAPASIALELQRPLPDDALVIVARGSRQDGGEPELRAGVLL